MRVLVLATDIYTRGGIARYAATLATALGELLGPGSVDLLPLLDDPERRFIPAEYRILSATTDRLTLRQKIRHLARAFRQGSRRYDLLFCGHASLAPIATLVRSRYGTPYVVVCYGSEVWDRLPIIKRLALQQASLVLADSRFTAEAIADANGVPQGRIKLLLNAIPDDLVCRLVQPGSDREQESVGYCHSEEPQATKNLLFSETSRSFAALRMTACGGFEHDQKATSSAKRQDDRILLSVGSLSTEHSYKGVDTVIEVLPRVAEAVPGVQYVVVGDGDNRAALEQFARRRGVSGRVTFAGEVTDAQLAEHYRVCDVFVLPSRASRRRGRRDGCTEGEGFGRVYVEAALAGKPVVGSREGGAPEAVLDERTGLLVDPRSPNEIAEAVIGLLRAPERAAAMGAEGRRWALENFTIEAMRRSVAEILLSVAPCPRVLGRRSSVFSHAHKFSTRHRPLATDDGKLTTAN